MSKRFDGIAIAKDLGQDNGANSSVLENVKGVLYAENINSVIYYDKNLDQLNDGEAPTKKYVQPLRDTNDSIQISISNFNNWGYTEQEFINSIEQQFGETDPENVLTSIDSIYECYPSNSEYRIEWNGKTYYKWNCISYDLYGSNPYTKYFLTETCNYTELQQRTMRYAYERGLAYWDKTYKLSTISVAEFDEDNNEIDYGGRISDDHDLRITDIAYIKNAKSTTINYDDVQGVKYVDIKIGGGKEQSTCDWITLTIGTGNLSSSDKRYICNPSDPNYIFTYNNLKYFLWKYLGTGNADQQYWTSGSEQHSYFITTIADYDVLLNCVGNTLNNYLIAEFNINKNEVSNILGSNKITSVRHFPGLYFKSVGSTEIGMVHDSGSDINNPNIEYSTNYGRTWSAWNGSTILLSDEQIILFRGLNPDGFNNYSKDLYSNFTIGGSGTILAYGSVMSLIDQIGELLTIPTNDNGGCFLRLFFNCDKLVKAPALPATSLADYCYQYMFNGCASLSEAPTLPATSLAGSCYYGMFNGCTSLTDAPALPATSLADYCYQYMFNGCASLSEAPTLPATSLAGSCYYGMFNGCTSLVEAPILPATRLVTNCYRNMFLGCTSLKKAPALPATSLATYCYASMFLGCTSLSEAPALPALSLATWCYISMFSGCTSLTKAPVLPATSLATRCYYNMFYGCTSLTKGHTLPATSLANYCYASMFLGCTSLTEAPALPATSLATLCYASMFLGCTSLTEAPALPATSLATLCYSIMYYGCKNLSYINCSATTNITKSNCNNWVNGVAPYGTFVKNPSAKWSTGTSGIPTNWIVSDPDMDNKVTNFVSIHILLDPKITTPSITITFSSISANQVLEYTKTTGGWTTVNKGDSVTITGTEILYLRGTLSSNNTTSDYTNILITSSNGSKAMLSGNCNAIWNYNSPSSSLSYLYCGYKLFYGSKAITKVSKGFLPATSLAIDCYYFMFLDCTSLIETPILPATKLVTLCYLGMFLNCASLTDVPALPVTNLANYCYLYMFRGCTSLINAPALPATRLAMGCYSYMFYGCTSLIEAPALPATSLINFCYLQMFDGCTSLTEAPTLPATSLAIGCYLHMFRGCTSLTEAPILPATSLASRCYSYMFYGCKNLSYINCNATTNITTTNCNNWVNGVAPYGTFYKNSSATWTTGTSGIPSSWNPISLNNINSENNCIEIRLDSVGNHNEAIIEFVKISTNHTLQYKDSGHNSWTTVSAGDTIILSYTDNPVVLLKGDLSAANTTSNYTLITISGKNTTHVKLIGNCNYLWNSDPNAPLKSYCGYRLFYDSTAITKVSKDFLPATSLANYCYYEMFNGCTRLSEAPALPATNLASNCYLGMFYHCTALKKAPELPATSLASGCYYYMFLGCTALTEAPVLPATSLASDCYSRMFNGCTSLIQAPTLPATNLADYCYNCMFYGCTSLSKVPALPATSLAGACYNGMFYNCASLTEAPALPATSLANYCYNSMFWGCTALTEAPALPATSLATNCYNTMFNICTSLSKAPALPATSLASGCYYAMFNSCTSLTEAPALPATSLATNCYYRMFYGCTSLTEAPALPATSLADSCYYIMFLGCASLNEVICFATTNSYSNSTTDWLAKTSSSGKIYSKTTKNISVPSGWTIQTF